MPSSESFFPNFSLEEIPIDQGEETRIVPIPEIPEDISGAEIVEIPSPEMPHDARWLWDYQGPIHDLDKEQVKEALDKGGQEIIEDLAEIGQVVEDCAVSYRSQVVTGLDVIHSCLTSGVMTILVDEQNFLAEYQALITTAIEIGLISTCEAMTGIVEMANSVLDTVELTEQERNAIQGLLPQYQAGLDRMDCPEGVVHYNPESGGLDIPCEIVECDEDETTEKPRSFVPDDCPEDAIKVQLCGLESLISTLTPENKSTEEEGEEETAVIAWYNCVTQETQFLPVRKKPEGDDWEKAGEAQEVLDKLVACLCELAEETGEDPQKTREAEFFQMVGSLADVHIENCKLPDFVSLDHEVIQKVMKVILASAAGLTAAQAVSILPVVGKLVNSPGFSVVFMLWGVVQAYTLSLTVAAREPKLRGIHFIAYTSRTWYTFWERILPGTFIEQIEACDQVVKLAIPKGIPNQEQANFAFLSADINLEQWQCITRANGNSDSFMAPIVKSQRSKMRPAELLLLFHRKEINQVEFVERIRELGFIKDTDAAEFEVMSEQLPNYQELIRFMVRDVEDPAVVQRFNLDADFGNKFQGQVKEWAEWQNIPEDVMLKNWMAHWRYPGYRQLAEAMHRFRNEPQGSKIRTTTEDVKAALIADDIPEFWVDRMIAMSFSPLTRIDARRAFRIGAIDEQELSKSFDDLGYSDTSTKAMVKFTKKERDKAFMKHTAVKQLAAGTIAHSDFIQWLQDDGASPEIIDMASDRARLLRRAMTTKRCVDAVHKKYLLGENDRDEVYRELRGLEIENQIAIELADAWTCEKAAQGKNASLSLLCQWFENGTMNVDEYHSRLKNLGWDQEDSKRIIRLCSERIDKKVTTAEARRMNAREKEIEKQRKAEEKNASLQKRKEETAIKSNTRKVDKARASRLKQDKILAAAAEKFAKRVDTGFVDVFAEIKAIFNRTKQSTGIHPDIVATAIKEVSDDPKIESLRSLESGMFAILRAESSFAQ